MLDRPVTGRETPTRAPISPSWSVPDRTMCARDDRASGNRGVHPVGVRERNDPRFSKNQTPRAAADSLTQLARDSFRAFRHHSGPWKRAAKSNVSSHHPSHGRVPSRQLPQWYSYSYLVLYSVGHARVEPSFLESSENSSKRQLEGKLEMHDHLSPPAEAPASHVSSLFRALPGSGECSEGRRCRSPALLTADGCGGCANPSPTAEHVAHVCLHAGRRRSVARRSAPREVPSVPPGARW